MTETVVDLKASLDPMTRSVLNYPNGYGLCSALFWAISFGCVIGLCQTNRFGWLIGAIAGAIVAGCILGAMFVALWRANRFVAALSADQNEPEGTE